MPSLFTCPHGHQWEAAAEVASREETPLACPVCGAVGESAMPPTWVAGGDELPPLPHPLPARAWSAETEPTAAGWSAPAGYEIVSELGRGGMGVVYLARQKGLNRLVALKMILAGAHAGLEERERFRAEAEAVAQLQHPHIVQVFEVGAHEGRPFFSMEYVPGGSLDRHLAGTPQPARAAAELVCTLAGAVQAAHERGIVHRDLKPANVLLASDRRASSLACPAEEGKQGCLPYDAVPKITDFGLAKRLDTSSGRTPSRAVLGTPSYMAPEQAQGRSGTAGPAVDVYALGAILYECLTGRPPFKAETPLDTMVQVVAEDPVPPRSLQPKVPRDLETVCLKCLHKEPSKRYASAAELADDLTRFLDDRPILARSAGAGERLLKFARRNKAAVGGVAAVFVALVLGIVGTSIGLARARADRTLAREAERNARADRDRARQAERAKGELLAASHVQAARLAMQRGAWRAALDNLDQALQAGHPDTVGLRFDKMRALHAVHEVPRALRELEALARRRDLGAYEGPVLLWRGDLAWDRTADPAALELVRRALGKKLAPADAAYARGLLADTSPKAIAHFRAALQADPFHRKANAMMGSLLLLLGRLDEAREPITFGARLFPEDPTFKVLQAVRCALQGDRAAADVLLKQAARQVTAPQVATARAMVDLFSYVHRVNKVLDGAADLSLARLRQEVMPAFGRLKAVQRGVRHEAGPATADFLMPLPPVFVKACRPLPAATTPMLWLNFEPMIAQLERTATVHPEGMLHFLRGVLLFQKERWAQAEQAFGAAAATPSIANVRKVALLGAVTSAWNSAPRPGAPGTAELKARAHQNTRALAALGGTPGDSAGFLADVALGLGDVDLARRFVAAWEQQERGSSAALRKRLQVEFAGGAYGRVLDLARQLLARNPGDEVAIRHQALARARILRQARGEAPDKGKGSE
jgi:tetratricopeptide (TPR) repeat protein